MRYLMLFIPVMVALSVPLYNVIDNRWIGIPFYWWFQLLMIPVSVLFLLAAYLGDRK